MDMMFFIGVNIALLGLLVYGLMTAVMTTAVLAQMASSTG